MGCIIFEILLAVLCCLKNNDTYIYMNTDLCLCIFSGT